MQLMPRTQRLVKVSDPFNASQNINGGTRYLKSLIIKYNGNITLAVAAYNAGSGAVGEGFLRDEFFGAIEIEIGDEH